MKTKSKELPTGFPGGRWRRWGAAGCALAMVYPAWLFLRDPTNFMYRYFPDDALFYNIISRNLIAGLGSTSDGIAQSNGYHPLWLGVLTALTAVFGGQSLLAEGVLLLMVAGISLYLLYCFIARHVAPPVALAAVVALAAEPMFFSILLSGMETALAFLFLMTTLHLTARLEPAPASRGGLWLLAGSLALLFFARLDGGLLWVALAGLYLWRGGIAWPGIMRRARLVFALLAGPALLGIGYFWLNSRHFSSFMPVSGRIKSIDPASILTTDAPVYLTFALERLQRLYSFQFFQEPLRWLLAPWGGLKFFLFNALYLVPILAVLAGAFLNLRRRRLDLPAGLLFTYALLHTLYYTFLQSDTYSLRWAHGPEMALMVLALCAIVPRPVGDWLHRSNKRSAILILAVFLAVQAVQWRGRSAPSEMVHDFGAAVVNFNAVVAYVDKTIPPDMVIATANVGFFGWVTGRRVLSVDGLLNSNDYYRNYLARGRVYAYMREHGVRVIVDAVPRSETPEQYLHGRYPDLPPGDILTLREFSEGLDIPRVSKRYLVVTLR